MRNIVLSQVNYQYGENTFLPYSVGRLWAHAKQNEKIAAGYKLDKLLFLREPIQKRIDWLEEPDVFGASCYIWNWNYQTTLAKAIKERWTDCLVILGGPQVPNRLNGFWEAYPYVDVVIHGEGEEVFTRTLLERLEGQIHHQVSTKPFRSVELDSLPSPYLEGIFDEVVKLPFDFHASQETSRGCPYQCTFCDWGSATMSKVRAFTEDRVAKEIDWFAKQEIELVYNCDANYGMLKQDMEHTQRLINSKWETGFPKSFRAAYAKKTTPRVFAIAKALSDADMSKGVTISVQSMNDRTLEMVKRQNIKTTDLAELVKAYRDEGVPTYTEIILGLPGETYGTFADGLASLMAAGQHESISIYPCIKLQNSEMGDPEYVREHGIETVTMPMLLLHGSPGQDECPETYELIVATKDMPYREWREAYLFGWAVQTFHCLGLLRLLAVESKLSYRTFYEKLIQFAWDNPGTLIGEEIRKIEHLLDSVIAGRPWDTMVKEAGNVTWPPEEASFLRLMKNQEMFYGQIRMFVAYTEWQTERIHLLNKILKTNQEALIKPSEYEDFETYAREIVWYGRKAGKFLKQEKETKQ